MKLWELRKELVELRKKGGRSAAPSARWVNFAFRRARACSMMEHIQELARRTQPQKDGVYAFYDLWLALRDLISQEESCRTSKSEFCLSRAEDRLWKPLEMRGTTTSRLAG